MSGEEEDDVLYSRQQYRGVPERSFDRTRLDPLVARSTDQQPWPDYNHPQLSPYINPFVPYRSAPGMVPYSSSQNLGGGGYVPANGDIPPPWRPYPGWIGQDSWDYKTRNPPERPEEANPRQPNEGLRKIRDDIKHTLATQNDKLRKIQSSIESTRNNSEETRRLIELIAHEDRGMAMGVGAEPQRTGTGDHDTPQHERRRRYEQEDLERQQERTNRNLASRFNRDRVRSDKKAARADYDLGQPGLRNTGRRSEKPPISRARKSQDGRGSMQGGFSHPIINRESMSGALPIPFVPNLKTETFGSAHTQTKDPSHRTIRYRTRIPVPVHRNFAFADIPKRPPFPTAEDAPPISSSPAPPTPQPATTASKTTKSQTRIPPRSTGKPPIGPSPRQHTPLKAKGTRPKAKGAQDAGEMPRSRRDSSPGRQDGREILDEHLQEQQESDDRSFPRGVSAHAPQDDESESTKSTEVQGPRASQYYGILPSPTEDDVIYNESHTGSADGDSLDPTSQESYSPFEAHSSSSFDTNQSVSKSSLSVVSSYATGPHPISDILSARNGQEEHISSRESVETHDRGLEMPAPSKFEATEPRQSSLKLRISSHFKEQMYDAMLDALCDASRVIQAPKTTMKPMMSAIPQIFVREARSSRRRRFSGHAYTSSGRWSEESAIGMRSHTHRRSPGHGGTNPVVESESAQDQSPSRMTIHSLNNNSQCDQELGTQYLSGFAPAHEPQHISGDSSHSFGAQDSKSPAKCHSIASSQVSAKQEGGAMVGLSTLVHSANQEPQVPSIQRSGVADAEYGDVLDSDSDQSFRTASAGCSRRGSLDDNAELGVRYHGTTTESGKHSSDDIAAPSLFSDPVVSSVEDWRHRGPYQTDGGRSGASLPSVPFIPSSQQQDDYYRASPPQTSPLVPSMLMIPARGHSYYLVPLRDGAPSLAVPGQHHGGRTQPDDWHPQASSTRETEPDLETPVFLSTTRIRRRRHEIYRKERNGASTEGPEVI